MRISLLAGVTLYPLAGQSGVSERVHSSSGDLRINGQAEKQIAGRVRATYAAVYDRGNLLTTVTFSTTRTFATAKDAELFSADYDATFPRAGTLVLESINPAAEVFTRHILNAVISPPERRTIGATLFLTYTATGGEIVEVEGSPDPGTTWDTDAENWEN